MARGAQMPLIKYQWQHYYEPETEVVVAREHAAIRPVNFAAAVQDAEERALYSPKTDGQYDCPDQLVYPFARRRQRVADETHEQNLLDGDPFVPDIISRCQCEH